MPLAKFYYQNPEAPIPEKQTIGVMAIVKNNGKILLEKRSDNCEWGLIGGSVKQNETFLEAVQREVVEETGLTIHNFKLIGTFSDPSRIACYPDGNVVRIISILYETEIGNDYNLMVSEESLDLKFFDKNEIMNLQIVATHKHVLESYLSNPNTILQL